jgi:hypothetical protein
VRMEEQEEHRLLCAMAMHVCLHNNMSVLTQLPVQQMNRVVWHCRAWSAIYTTRWLVAMCAAAC